MTSKISTELVHSDSLAPPSQMRTEQCSVPGVVQAKKRKPCPCLQEAYTPTYYRIINVQTTKPNAKENPRVKTEGKVTKY